VQQQDSGTFTDVGDVEAGTVGRDIPMGPWADGPDGRIGLG
jgi:hypothetical protein